MLFWGEMNVMQSIGMQLALYTEDPAHLAALLRAAEGVMEGFDVEAVSYTHLDVYKRQGLRRRAAGHRTEGAECAVREAQ